ncbi:MAG: reactive intermediate/imine deaminase [Deltaproteobacteria bacterium HGW-Deltaproteobacteria-18]|jgi:2-iminobutanoate/2-iminopropanoate deaminase|nr:MAG: reactive intermediate/imine deaminase [Deltaproteobacteria bacterium HGW-Deltaproteobacteria-18]
MSSKIQITSEKAPAAVGPYSHAIAVPGLVFVSGQLPIDKETGTFPDGIEEQAHQALKNLKAVTEAAGATLGDVVKTTVFLADMNDFKVVNAVYATYFSEPFPARSAFEVAKLPLGAKVEIEAIVSRRD